MDLARMMDNLCQRLIGADEKYVNALHHIEELYEKGATEKEKDLAWVWLRSAQIDREYLQKSFAKDAIPIYAISNLGILSDDKH